MGKSKKIAGHAASIEDVRRKLKHMGRKLEKRQRALKADGDVPAEVIEAIHLARRQLSHAVDLLDLTAGQAARDELTGEDGSKP